MGESRNVDHAEGITPAPLGASRFRVEAFRSAVVHAMRRWEVTEREAIQAIGAGGRWPALVAADAEDADQQLDLTAPVSRR